MRADPKADAAARNIKQFVEAVEVALPQVKPSVSVDGVGNAFYVPCQLQNLISGFLSSAWDLQDSRHMVR